MLAKTLKRLRRSRGLTQVGLAKRVRMHQPYLAALESGSERNPRLDTLRRLAKALKVKPSALLD